MNRFPRVLLPALVVITGLLAFLPAATRANTITVHPGESIQQAINTAQEGDTIVVEPGVFHENLTVSKPLTIEGAGGGETAVDANANGTVVKIDETDPVHQAFIRFLTLENGDAPFGGGGIDIHRGMLTLDTVKIESSQAAGPGGGGIWNETGATLNVTNSTISGNTSYTQGGGILNNGTATLSNTQIVNNVLQGTFGGGIANYGTLTIDGSTISGNNAQNGAFGGGIHNGSGAQLTITSTVISNNTIGNQGFGGGMTNAGTTTIDMSTVRDNQLGGDGVGGGIANSSPGTLTITNSTISGNKSTSGFGGGIFNGGHLVITNGTIAGNTVMAAGNCTPQCGGGGIETRLNGSSLLLFNVTIAGNSGPLANEIAHDTGGDAVIQDSIIGGGPQIMGGAVSISAATADCSGTIISQGHNISTDASCSATAAGDQPTTDPMIGAPADNGGPTKTMALAAGSPAIDAASNNCPPPNADQRGVARPQGPKCDIGAYEAELATSSPSPSPTPSSTPIQTPVCLPGGAFCPLLHYWGDGDCNLAVAPRDGQAILNHFLGKAELSQTPPCPALGGPVTVAGASHTWGDFDCNGAVAPRDGQAILNHFLGKTELSVTPPCPAIGDTVTIS